VDPQNIAAEIATRQKQMIDYHRQLNNFEELKTVKTMRQCQAGLANLVNLDCAGLYKTQSVSCEGVSGTNLSSHFVLAQTAGDVARVLAVLPGEVQLHAQTEVEKIQSSRQAVEDACDDKITLTFGERKRTMSMGREVARAQRGAERARKFYKEWDKGYTVTDAKGKVTRHEIAGWWSSGLPSGLSTLVRLTEQYYTGRTPVYEAKYRGQQY
jgi:hypothetical protein